MTLFYPKWIPGEHMPSGPIANLTGLHIFADGTELDWRRDLVEMNAFAFTVPAGAKTLTAKYDYVVPTRRRRVRIDCLDQREDRRDQLVHRRPLSDGREPGGDHGHGDAQGAGRLEARRLARRRRASTARHDPLRADVARDAQRPPGAARRALPQHHAVARGFAAPASTSSTSSPTASGRCSFRSRASRPTSRSCSRSARVFGDVGHYRKYHWLLTLSDNLGAFGVEHHECADDRVAENTFVDDDAAKRSSLLLPHEFFHSWNGKARRPAGLVTGGYEKPMKDDLLWVYEGLTELLRRAARRARRPDLAARSGSTRSPPTRCAVSAPGRTWRPLQDTADSAPFLYTAGGGWSRLAAQATDLLLRRHAHLARGRRHDPAPDERQEDARRLLRAVPRPERQRPRLGEAVRRRRGLSTR